MANRDRRLAPRLGVARDALRYINGQRRQVSGVPCCPLKDPCKKLAPLTSCAFLRAKSQVSADNADADKLVAGRGDARFVLAVRARCQK